MIFHLKRWHYAPNVNNEKQTKANPLSLSFARWFFCWVKRYTRFLWWQSKACMMWMDAFIVCQCITEWIPKIAMAPYLSCDTSVTAIVLTHVWNNCMFAVRPSQPLLFTISMVYGARVICPYFLFGFSACCCCCCCWRALFLPSILSICARCSCLFCCCCFLSIFSPFNCMLCLVSHGSCIHSDASTTLGALKQSTQMSNETTWLRLSNC